MTTTLEPTEKANGVPPIQLRSAHDFGIVRRALEDRKEEVEKMAKKNEEEGYQREARTQKADAAAIEQFILPALGGQTSLKLATAEEVRAGVCNRLRPIVRPWLKPPTIDPKSSKAEQEDIFRNRETQVVEKLAIYIEAYAAAIATEAYNAGYAARAAEPEAIALRMLNALDA